MHIRIPDLFVVVFFCFFLYLHALVLHSADSWASEESPTIGSPWLQLRKSPLFDSSNYTLSGVWGPALPVQNDFIIEKTYGRWIFGTPKPIKNMKKKDYAPSGWIYNRSLLQANDESTVTEKQEHEFFLGEYYFHSELPKRTIDKSKILYISFLSNLVLGESTLQQFSEFDENNSAFIFFPKIDLEIFPSAIATVKKGINLGFAGANLNFLQVETKLLKRKRDLEAQKKREKILQPPIIPEISKYAKEFILGRYLINKNINLHKLSNEEVDTYLYIRAIISRSLRACPNSIKEYWQNKPWFAFRMLSISGSPSNSSIWMQISIPGNIFFHSDQVFREATSEAELAFILLWPMVLMTRYQEIQWNINSPWEESIFELSEKEDTFRINLQHQSLKLSKTMDVSDAIATDRITTECIARAGYHTNAGLEYVQRLRSNKKNSWATWFVDHSVGLDYRLEQFQNNIKKDLADTTIPNATVINQRRLLAAKKLWNL